MIGQTISHYKVLEKLGEGGMGVVYKAEDTKLKRTVALKFLPPHLAASEQDKARFIQEAQAASALNHPNVCTIHAIEEYESQLFIAMEFVDGQTLREKSRGDVTSPLPMKQAIDIGIQIADGLAAAHEKGIVHRDIKPENIMIRKDGIVQIMDFGLAKLRASGSKITRLTKEGSTVGTAGYMSPEQVQGQDTDHRSDIFSYGVLLYELLTGQLPFKGVHETALAYEIVNVDATPMSALKPDIDASLDAIVLECLEKDINERAQSIKQVAVDLKKYKRESSRQRVSRVTAVRPAYSSSQTIVQPSEDLKPSEGLSQLGRLPWIVAGTFVVVSFVLAFLYFNRPHEEAQVIRATILPPDKMLFNNSAGGQGGGHTALSPDGTKLAFIAVDSSNKSHLFVRNLANLTAQELNGTGDAYYPFWSPDGKFIGFFAGGKLKKIDLSGTPPLALCDAVSGRGGSWSQQGDIVFSPNAFEPLYKVSAAGGTPVAVTALDTVLRERTHRWPVFLPDGNHFLYFARVTGTGGGINERDGLYVGSLDGTINKRIGRGQGNIAYAAGYLLFPTERTLMAQPFDIKKFELKGDPSPVAYQLQYDAGFNKANFSVSQNGILVYQSGTVQGINRLTIVDQSSKKVTNVGEIGEYLVAKFSPDGKKLAFDLFDTQARNVDIWIYDLVRNIRTRFTFDASPDRNPVWSPDGSRIVFRSDRKGRYDLYQKSISGSTNEELLLASNLDKNPLHWSSDGKYILYIITDPKTKFDIWVLPLFGDKKPFPFVQTEFSEAGARFSPDVRWIAYVSDESGKNEVYVRPFPGPRSVQQVSINGGTTPRWRKDGRQLFYISGDNTIMSAEVNVSNSTFSVGAVKPLIDFISSGGSTLQDITGDGQRFLQLVIPQETAPTPLTLVANFLTELNKK